MEVSRVTEGGRPQVYSPPSSHTRAAGNWAEKEGGKVKGARREARNVIIASRNSQLISRDTAFSTSVAAMFWGVGPMSHNIDVLSLKSRVASATVWVGGWGSGRHWWWIGFERVKSTVDVEGGS